MISVRKTFSLFNSLSSRWSRALAMSLIAVSLIVPQVGCGFFKKKVKADEVVRQVIQALLDNKPELIWAALPTTYQQDVHDLIKLVGQKVDAQLYKQTFTVLQKVVNVLRNKKDFILQIMNSDPMISPMVKQAISPQEIGQSWDGIVSVLDTVLNSELSDTNFLANPDMGKFLLNTGAKLMAQFDTLSKLVPQDQLKGKTKESLKGIKVTLVSEKGDDSEITIEMAGKSENLKMKKVEGKWIPADMSGSWKPQIASAKTNLETNLAKTMSAQEKMQFTLMLGMVGGAADKLDAAKTQPEFTAAFYAIAGQMMGSLGGGALKPPTSEPVKPTGPAGRSMQWTVGAGNKSRIDQVYLNQKPEILIKAFGQPDLKSDAAWIYRGLTIKNLKEGGTMKTAKFNITDGIVKTVEVSE